MKNWKKFICGILLTCFLSGCGSSMREGNGSAWSNAAGAVRIENQYYMVVDHTIYASDERDQRVMKVWCNKSKCSHSDEDECPALIYQEFDSSLCTDGKYLYIAAENDSHTLCWYRYSLAEGAVSKEEYAEIISLPEDMDCSMETFYHDGTAYFSLGLPDEGGNWSWKLYRQKLSGSKSGKAEVIYEPESGTHLENLSVYGKRVYGVEWKVKGRIFSVNPDGSNPETVLDQVFPTSYILFDKQLYYTDKTSGIHCIDQDTGSERILREEIGPQAILSWDGKYLYADNFNAVRPIPGEEYDHGVRNFMGRFIYVMEQDGALKDKINMMYMGGVSWFGPGEELFVNNGALNAFDKSRIGDPENQLAEDEAHRRTWSQVPVGE